MIKARTPGQYPAWLGARARIRLRELLTFPLLASLIVVIGAVAPEVGPQWLSPALVNGPLLVGGAVLRRRPMLWLIAVAVAAVAYDGYQLGWREVRPDLPLLLVTAVAATAFAARREQLGVPGMRGEGMLLELRERLSRQGSLPSLPRGWHAEFALETAGHAGFSGDFLVSSSPEAGRLELALVDVSGKGFDAGTRSLMLSGALGGLLGAVPPHEFLPAANAYLLRQEWGDGFATAVHIAIDLQTGDYFVESAGHPPAAHYISGTGRWVVSQAAGMPLGMFDNPEWTAGRGRLRSGDLFLMYTDGVVEIPGRDVEHGVDRLLGAANALVLRGFAGGAERLINAVGTDTKDDRAVVTVWRR
ncbi:MAG: PP2C family protein-serine/threonine phosphatase [Mycobacteriales bacterium]